MNTTEAIRAALDECGVPQQYRGAIMDSFHKHVARDAALVRPMAVEGARYKLLLAAEEFDGIADEYKQQGHDSGSESAKCRAYELREIARTLAATPQAVQQEVPTCKKCGGSGVVDDGEIGFYEGTSIPFENGPVKCVKDCPACKSRASQPQAQAAVGEPVAQYQYRMKRTLGGWTDWMNCERPIEGEEFENRALYTATQPSPAGAAWEQLRMAASVIVLACDHLRGDSPRPPEIKAISDALDLLAATPPAAQVDARDGERP